MRNSWKVQILDLNAFIRTLLFFVSFLFTFPCRSNVVRATCPVQCSCIPAASMYRVTCGSGLASFPTNLPSNTAILFISVPKSPTQQYNTISSISASDVSGIKDVQTMTLIRSNLMTIAPSTFSQLIKLTVLDLKDNKISRLSRSVFSGLSKLQSLDLSQNRGCLLDDDVFTDLNGLKTLRLGEIGIWDIGALLSPLISLEELDLHGNDMFRLKATSLIHLNNLKYLDLTFNDLYNVEDSLKPVMSKLKSLHLEKNPWRCNCALTWIKTLPLQFIAPSHSNGGPLYCSEPPALRLKEVLNVADADMKCMQANVISCSGPYSVRNGGRLSMTCDVEGDPFPDIKWLRPDGLVANQSVMTRPRSTAQLILAASDFTAHNGVWKISADNFKGSDSVDFKVEVITTTSTLTTTTTTSTTTTTTTTTTTPTKSTAVSTKLKSSSTISTTPSAKASKAPHVPGPSVSPSNPGTIGGTSKNTPKNPHATSTTLQPGGISKTPVSATSETTPNLTANINSEERSIIAIVVACISGGICVIGVCIFGAVLYKSKQRRRIRVRKRSTYSTAARDPEVFTLYIRTPAASGRLGLN